MIKLTEMILYNKWLYEPESGKAYELIFSEVEIDVKNIQYITIVNYGNSKGTFISLNGGEHFNVKENYEIVKNKINLNDDFVEYNNKYYINKNFIYSITNKEDNILIRLNNDSISIIREFGDKND